MKIAEQTAEKISPFSIGNIRLFIAFRVLYNARFYYPVFTILFLDFGLTIEQFSLLNAVWALTIVVAEVPSGALADLLGRKKLLVATSLLMILELGILAFVPLGNGTLLFWAFFINRIFSGLAEAMASGADEAIAYDSLLKEGLKETWPQVLSLQMRIRSIAAIVTMTIGALIYDPKAVNTIFAWCHSTISLDQQTTMRFPIYGTLLLAILAFITALQMRETQKAADVKKQNISSVLTKTIQAASWIWRTPFALSVILFAMFFDHILRMQVTMISQYFRLMQLPEASFGVIGSAISLLGLITPKIAEIMAERYSPRTNLCTVFFVCFSGLVGLAYLHSSWGLLPVVCIFLALTQVSFFSSHYLNQISDSEQRATILSFKGLACNIAYAFIGWAYAYLVSGLQQTARHLSPQLSAEQITNTAFTEAAGYFPWYGLVFFLVIFVLSRMRTNAKQEKQREKHPT